ncbi:MAG: Mov34/MPN/PAD-1 family protein [Methanomassiliicoccales archaeon]
MPLFSRRRVSGRASAEIDSIKLDVLEAIMEASKRTLPNEFVAGLRASGNTIVELALFPGAVRNFHSATFNYHGVLGDFRTVGTVHSHPSGVIRPSAQDLRMFTASGRVHMIAGYPFRLTDWRAFDKTGSPVMLSVVRD